MNNIENVLYISVWDGGFEVITKAKYNKETKEVFDIEGSDIDGDELEVLDGEFIELSNGDRLKVESKENGYFVI